AAGRRWSRTRAMPSGSGVDSCASGSHVVRVLHNEDGMRQVTAREANQHFAKVLSAVEAGEQVVISKHGKPVAVMSPYKPALDAEHKAAVARMIASMDEPVVLGAPFRTITRDEMHER